MFIIPLGNVIDIVGQMRDYMYEKGIDIGEANLKDSSPYAITKSGTSLNFRTETKNLKNRKWPADGILFCCKEEDCNLLSTINGTKVFPNTEKTRPYAVFIPDVKFDEAIEKLKRNPKNRRKV